MWSVHSCLPRGRTRVGGLGPAGYGYALVDIGAHPNPAKAAIGQRLHGLGLDEQAAPVVARIFAEFLAGAGLYAIAEALTRDGFACPSAHDRARNRHRSGVAWSKSAVRAILTNPRYTGHQVWNRQRKDEVLVDVEDVALGHETKLRWNSADAWVRSAAALPALDETRDTSSHDRDMSRSDTSRSGYPGPTMSRSRASSSALTRNVTSPEGVLSVMPPPDYDHAVIATRIMLWLAAAGIAAERLTHTVARASLARTARIPDLVVWAKTQARAVWLPVADVLLVVEIISPGSEATDTVAKRHEYAGAGIPQYWTVDRTLRSGHDVPTRQRRVSSEGHDAARMVLNRDVAEHLG
jgi:hypothetical protein